MRPIQTLHSGPHPTGHPPSWGCARLPGTTSDVPRAYLSYPDLSARPKQARALIEYEYLILPRVFVAKTLHGSVTYSLAPCALGWPSCPLDWPLLRKSSSSSPEHTVHRIGPSKFMAISSSIIVVVPSPLSPFLNPSGTRVGSLDKEAT